MTTRDLDDPPRPEVGDSVSDGTEGPALPNAGSWLAAAAAALLLPVGLLVQHWAASRPDLVEREYSRGLSEHLTPLLARVSGLVPFSLAEVLLALLVIRVLVGGVRTATRVAGPRGGSLRTRLTILGHAMLRLAGLAGALFAAYLLTWGLNHQRRPFAEESGLEVETPTPHELSEAAFSLVGGLLALRAELEEDAHGVSRVGHGRRELDRLARDAFDGLSSLHPGLHRAPGVSKRPLSSPLLSASWISGVYSPFTAEANVNSEVPEPQLGFVTCHELAHSLGFAREDEASFLAVMACRNSDDPALRYSGALAAWRYLTAALQRAEPTRWIDLEDRLDDAVRRDLEAIREFWSHEHTAFTEVATKVNNAYLKSQGQEAGVASYGLAVDLIVAEWRTRRPNFEEEPLASALEAARGEEIRVAFLGGCMTSGGVEPERLTYPQLVVDTLEQEGFALVSLDLSACHQTSFEARAALPLALDWGADVVVLELGAGDLTVGRRVETVAEDLRWMVSSARRAGARVLLLVSFRPELAMQVRRAIGMQNMLRTVAKERDIPCVEDFTEGVGGTREHLRHDLEHPNSTGIVLLADRMVGRLKRLLTLVLQQRALEAVARDGERER